VTRIAPERRSDVRLEIASDEELVSDPVAFDRWVGNLIANALEYGRPPVVVSAAGASVAVEDVGPGVPPEFAEALGGPLDYESGDRGGARFVFDVRARSVARP
jgi:signal transduction histidine kinase